MKPSGRQSSSLVSLWWMLFLLIPLFHLTTILMFIPEPGATSLPDPPPQGRWFVDSWRMVGPGVDFFSFYQAGIEYAEGRSIYATMRDDATAPFFYPYRYLPPLAAVSAVTLRWFSPWTAYKIWLGVILAGFLLSLYMVHRLFEGIILRPFVLAVWCATPLLFVEMWIGQINMITAAFVLAIAYWGRTGRMKSAMAAWSAAVLLKVYPAIIGIVFVRKHLLKPLAVTLVAMAAVVLLSFVLAGQSMAEFVGRNFGAVSTTDFHVGNQGFAMLLYYALRNVMPVSVWIVALRLWQILIIGGAAAVIWRRKTPVHIGVMVMALTYLLSYQNVWSHHYLLVLPAASVFLAEAWERNHNTAIILACFALLAMLPPGLFAWFNDAPYLTFYPGQNWPVWQMLSFRLLRLLPLGLAAVSGGMLLFGSEKTSAKI